MSKILASSGFIDNNTMYLIVNDLSTDNDQYKVEVQSGNRIILKDTTPDFKKARQLVDKRGNNQRM